jgi:hypothetical protein
MSPTSGYTVAMPVVSIRFARDDVHERLKRAASREGVAMSPLAERLIDEGLRMDNHPLIVFRSGPTGRRPAVAGGPDIAEVVGAILGGDIPPSKRRLRASELLGLTLAQIDAAMAYYAEFTEEVDAELAARADEAARHERLWRRQRDLLTR